MKRSLSANECPAGRFATEGILSPRPEFVIDIFCDLWYNTFDEFDGVPSFFILTAPQNFWGLFYNGYKYESK
ncbi:MAG: hypothetical protein IJX89_00850 [Alphaproteobacteria bacterium]|nr:hypothetical protein [Alphaproteobacteria bacterium]